MSSLLQSPSKPSGAVSPRRAARSLTRARLGGALGAIALAGLLVLPACWPLLLPGFLVTDDGLDHVIRAWALGERLAAGDLLPRWIPELGLGHGYPLFAVYAPGIYYPWVALRWLTGGYLGATEVLTGGLLFVLGAGAYCFAARWHGRRGGVLACVATVYAPYALFDAESRMSLPELAVLAGIPWLLLASDRLF